MAFKANKNQQLGFMDSYNTLSDRNKRFLDNSWAKGFAEIVFPSINEERFAVLYSDNKASRPNTPVNVVIGALMIKEMFGQTDEELLESIMLDVRYQYALHTTSCEDQPISDRSFSRLRAKALRYEEETGVDLIKQEMHSLAGCYCEFLNISPGIKRMDSLMVASNCKTMSRLELFYTCVANVVNMISCSEGSSLPCQFQRYLAPEDKNDTIYRCKPDESRTRLEVLANDAVDLLEIARDDHSQSEDYQNLKRLVDEQVVIKKSVVKLREAEEIPANSLQNPSDPDATYRRKAGKKHTGYVANVVETTDENGSIITQYDYQPNVYSDHSFGKDVIEELGKQTDEVKLIADGAYNSMENIELAKENNIDLVTTSMTGKAPSVVHSGFEINREEHFVSRCPARHEPIKSHYNPSTQSYRIVLDKGHCIHCRSRGKCNAKIQKKTAMVNLS